MKRALCSLLLMTGLAAPLLGLGGCGDECSAAASRCEDCEQVLERCKRFEVASADACAKALDEYEVSCPSS